MGEFKPLGSEKLQGQDKLKRILELTYYNNPNNKRSERKSEFIAESTNGVYGIVKEKDGYYVKKGLNESSLDYIGGLFMKNKNKFSSYGEALKRLELLKGQEIQEAKKYILKQNKGGQSAPSPEEDPSAIASDALSSDSQLPPPPPPSGDGGGEGAPMPSDGAPMPSDGGEAPSPEPEESKRSDYMSEIQKHAGKLGQSLRDVKEKLESDDIKYTINMILSAVDLEKLDPEDKEEIASRFDDGEDAEGDEEGFSDDESIDDLPDLSGDSESEPAPPSSDDDADLDEVMDKLETFINSKIDGEEEEDTYEMDFAKYADIGENDDFELPSEDSIGGDDFELPSEDSLGSDEEGLGGETGGEEGGLSSEDEIEIIDLDEIKNEINKSISSTLGKYFK